MANLNEDDIVEIKRFELQIEPERTRLQAVLKGTTTDSQRTNTPSDDRHESDSTEVDEVPGRSAMYWDCFSFLTCVDLKDAISSLLLRLVGHPVAKKLRLRDSRTTVNRQLALLYGRIDESATATFLPLAYTIVQNSSDIEIWKQVLLLITPSSRITPSPSVLTSFGGTPRTHTSASHQGSEQTKRLLHDPLRDELHDCSYVKVEGFFEKYFDNKSWTQKSKDIFDAIKPTHLDGRWSTFPSHPVEGAVWEWWSQLQDKHLPHARGIYYTTTSKNEMVNTDGESQLDMFVKSRDATTSDRHDWVDVRVIGEHTVSKEGGKKFLQLTRYARNIFSAQPRRQFIHGFILSHTKMELHVFDRSGTFSIEAFDIHDEPERFIRVISGYCMMSDDELGLDTFIQREGVKEFVTVNDASGKEKRIQLKRTPMVRRAAIVGRATSCYCTVDREAVVKFSWISTNKSPTEPELLKLANERKVKGIPRLIGHRQIVSTGKLRSPIGFSKKRDIKGRQHSIRQQQSKSSFSNQFASMVPFDEGKKRKSFDAGQGPSKKSRSNSQASKLSQVYEAGASFNDSQASQISQTADEPFIDRVLCIQATQPAGRPLIGFYDVSELLRAIRDAIKAHRSLFLDGKILHRDISESNIIITNPDENDGLSGILIDIEFGTIIENGKNNRTGLKRMTGTLKYMAIEVLELGLNGAQPDLEHTYRHDLESFFYVFLSMCVNYGWAPGSAPKEDPFLGWYDGKKYLDMMRAKRGDMERGGFRKEVLGQFSPTFESVKELALSLRDLLFLRGDELRTGTPAENESVLYDEMIGAFEKAIDSCDD